MLLENDPLATGLPAENPFAGAPPQEIRIGHYRYTFNRSWSGKPVWDRELIGLWLPPVSLKDEAFADYIHGNGWEQAVRGRHHRPPAHAATAPGQESSTTTRCHSPGTGLFPALFHTVGYTRQTR
jgi:hypothetical protein